VFREAITPHPSFDETKPSYCLNLFQKTERAVYIKSVAGGIAEVSRSGGGVII
jgi:hypothetical protein